MKKRDLKKQNNVGIIVVIFIVVTILVVGIIDFSIHARNTRKPHNTPKTLGKGITATPKPTPAEFTARYTIFMNRKRVSIDPGKNVSTDKKYFVTKDDPGTVHVKNTAVTWETLFKSLAVTFTDTCVILSPREQYCAKDSASLYFYLNGKNSRDLLKKDIKKDDTVVISVGVKPIL